MIKMDNSYLKKLDKMCFKKPILSINDYLQNRLIIYFPMYTNRLCLIMIIVLIVFTVEKVFSIIVIETESTQPIQINLPVMK